MDLEKDSNFGYLVANGEPYVVNEDANSRLRYPCCGFPIDCVIHSVKELPSVAKGVFDSCCFIELGNEGFMPVLYFWAKGEVPFLNLFHLYWGETNVGLGGNGAGLAEVVGGMAEAFESFVGGVVLGDGFIMVVFLRDHYIWL